MLKYISKKHISNVSIYVSTTKFYRALKMALKMLVFLEILALQKRRFLE